jgi:hypothetical protein
MRRRDTAHESLFDSIADAIWVAWRPHCNESRRPNSTNF